MEKKILRCFSWSYSTFPAHRNVRASKVSGTVTQSMFLLGLCTSMWKRTIPCVLTGRQHAVIVSRLLANALKSSWRRSVIAVVEVLSLGKRNAVSHAPLSGSCYPLESLTSDCSLAIVLAEMIFEKCLLPEYQLCQYPAPLLLLVLDTKDKWWRGIVVIISTFVFTPDVTAVNNRRICPAYMIVEKYIVHCVPVEVMPKFRYI